jgi:hypothetical protein
MDHGCLSETSCFQFETKTEDSKHLICPTNFRYFMIFNLTDPEIKILLDRNPHRIFLFTSNFMNNLVLLFFLV